MTHENGEWHLPHRGVRTRSWAGALNRVEEVVEDTCNDNWWLYVRLALPAAGAALRLLITPSPSEILEGYLEPASTRSGTKRPNRRDDRRRRGGRLNRVRRFARNWAQPDNQVGKRLPASGYFQGKTLSGTEHAFWTGYNIVERAAWYWLLYDAAKQFIYTWHSGIMESRRMSSCYAASVAWEAPRRRGTSNALIFVKPYWVELYTQGVTIPEVSFIRAPGPLYWRCWIHARWEGSYFSPPKEPRAGISIYNNGIVTASEHKQEVATNFLAADITVELYGFGTEVSFVNDAQPYDTGYYNECQISALGKSTPWVG